MMTYVLNIFKSIFCCLDIRQLQMIFTSQLILDIFLSKYVFINVGYRLFLDTRGMGHCLQ